MAPGCREGWAKSQHHGGDVVGEECLDILPTRQAVVIQREDVPGPHLLGSEETIAPHAVRPSRNDPTPLAQLGIDIPPTEVRDRGLGQRWKGWDLRPIMYEDVPDIDVGIDPPVTEVGEQLGSDGRGDDEEVGIGNGNSSGVNDVGSAHIMPLKPTASAVGERAPPSNMSNHPFVARPDSSSNWW